MISIIDKLGGYSLGDITVWNQALQAISLKTEVNGHVQANFQTYMEQHIQEKISQDFQGNKLNSMNIGPGCNCACKQCFSPGSKIQIQVAEDKFTQ